MMRTITLWLIILMILASASAIPIQEVDKSSKARTDQPVSLVLNDTPLPTALDSLFKNTGLRYEFAGVDADKTGSEWWKNVRVSVNISNVPFREAVKIIANAAGLRVIENKGVNESLEVVRNDAGFDVKDSSQPADYVFSPALASSNVAINRTQMLQNASQALSNQQTKQYPFKLNTKEGKSGKLISLQMEQANAFDVLAQVMNIYKKNYILDVGPAAEYPLIAPRITARLTDVTLEEFFDLLKSSSGIQVETRNNQTIIRWRPDQRAILPQTSPYQPFTMYYVYLLADSKAEDSIKGLLKRQANGPSLAYGAMGYLDWIRSNTGQNSIKILIAGSVSGQGTLIDQSSVRQQSSRRDGNMLAAGVGPISIDGMEFKADVYLHSLGTYKASQVSASIGDRLYWRPSGSIAERNSQSNQTLRWPADVTRIARTGLIDWPNGSQRIFILALTLSSNTSVSRD